MRDSIVAAPRTGQNLGMNAKLIRRKKQWMARTESRHQLERSSLF